MARVKGMGFLSRRYMPPSDEALRVRNLELYLTKQSQELYVKLSGLEKRITLLEEKMKGSQADSRNE